MFKVKESDFSIAQKIALFLFLVKIPKYFLKEFGKSRMYTLNLPIFIFRKVSAESIFPVSIQYVNILLC